MANCKFGLNDHKPFISKKSVHHHHHDKSKHNFIEKEQYIHSHDHEEHVHNHHEHRGTDKKVLKWALSINFNNYVFRVFLWIFIKLSCSYFRCNSYVYSLFCFDCFTSCNHNCK